MCINFQQNRVETQVVTVLTSLIAKNRKLLNLQLPIVILKKSILLDMHHHETYMYLIFSKIGLVDQSKPCTQIYL